jgi:hypothetical protein
LSIKKPETSLSPVLDKESRRARSLASRVNGQFLHRLHY